MAGGKKIARKGYCGQIEEKRVYYRWVYEAIRK